MFGINFRIRLGAMARRLSGDKAMQRKIGKSVAEKKGRDFGIVYVRNIRAREQAEREREKWMAQFRMR